MILTTKDGAIDISLEDCARMLFPQEGEAVPRLRFKGFEGEWEWKTIGDLCFSQPSNITQESLNDLDGVYPVYGASGFIKNIDTYQQDVPYIGVVKDGAGVGRVGLYPAYSSILGTMHYLLPKEGCDIAFLAYLLETIDLTETSSGSTIPHIYFKDYKGKKTLVPSLDEQRAIASFFSRLDSQKLFIHQQFESLKQLKSACLDSMFAKKEERSPRVRFKAYNDDWKVVPLSDCLVVNTERNTDGKYGRNEVLSVSDEYGVVNQIELLGRSFAGKSVANYRVLKHGDIVYTKSPLKVKPFGIIKVNEGENGIVSTLYAVYSPKECVSARFINYYFAPSYRMNKYIHPLVNKGAKNDMKVSDENVLKGTITIPATLEEQEQIAKFFSELDGSIVAQQQQLERLMQVKQSCLKLLFPDNQSITPPLRFKGFNGEWSRIMIGTIGVTYSGLSGKGKNDFGHGDAQYITFLNVLNNAQIDTSMFEKVDIKECETQNRVRKGDLLFNTSSETPEEVAMCAVMGEEIENLYLNSFCFGFRLFDENIDPLFLSYQMRSPYGRKLMSFIAQGATRYNLPKREFVKTEISIPTDKEEQRRIASFFSCLDKRIALQTQKVERLEQLKKACLSQMFE